MDNALTSIYYIIHKAIQFLYNMQIFTGVRVLYVFIATGLLSVIIHFLISIPRYSHHER